MFCRIMKAFVNGEKKLDSVSVHPEWSGRGVNHSAKRSKLAMVRMNVVTMFLLRDASVKAAPCSTTEHVSNQTSVMLTGLSGACVVCRVEAADERVVATRMQRRQLIVAFAIRTNVRLIRFKRKRVHAQRDSGPVKVDVQVGKHVNVLN